MFNRILSWFVPAALQQDVETFRQSRFVVGTCLLTSLFSAVYMVQGVTVEFEEAVYAMAFNVAAFLLLPFIFRWSGNVGVVANLYVLVGTIGVAVCTYYSGGLSSYVFPWFAALPNAGVLLGGYRAGWFWMGVSLLFVVAIGLLEVGGYVFPVGYDEADADALMVSSLAGIILIVFIIALVFQKEKQRALDKLDAKNAELIRAIEHLKTMQAQLVQQEKLASLGALTAGIAHEIKNPLNFITNFAQLSGELVQEIEAESDAEPERPISAFHSDFADLKLNVSKIEEHGKRADAIVRSMLDHSRGTTGERRSVEVNALVEEYVNLSYHGMRAQRADFTCVLKRDYDAQAGRIDVVPQEIGRVLINLLNNAFYAVHERSRSMGGASTSAVQVSTKRVVGGVEIQVWDNGGGIPAEIRDRVFEPFFTTKPTGDGTGLGLSLSYDIVTQMHGGKLTVHVEEGESTLFTVYLPTASKKLLLPNEHRVAEAT